MFAFLRTGPLFLLNCGPEVDLLNCGIIFFNFFFDFFDRTQSPHLISALFLAFPPPIYSSRNAFRPALTTFVREIHSLCFLHTKRQALGLCFLHTKRQALVDELRDVRGLGLTHNLKFGVAEFRGL